MVVREQEEELMWQVYRSFGAQFLLSAVNQLVTEKATRKVREK
jgi:hypothetical protein